MNEVSAKSIDLRVINMKGPLKQQQQNNSGVNGDCFRTAKRKKRKGLRVAILRNTNTFKRWLIRRKATWIERNKRKTR